MYSPPILRIASGLMFAWAAAAQPQPASPGEVNPLGHSEQAIQQGRELYSHTCTVCHGLNGAAGDRGPALGAGRSYNLRTDQAIFDAINKGIPQTAMPPSGLPPTDIWKIVAYIRSLRATASDAFVEGDTEKGAEVFREKGCSRCHMIRGQGGILGPDLSNVGGERPLQFIRDSLTKPRLPIPRGYRPVEVITTGGRRISGVAKNDDNFSLQLLDDGGHLQLFTHDELRQVVYPEHSLMPSNYDKVLSPAEFQNLLAFLSRQVTYKVERRRRRDE